MGIGSARGRTGHQGGRTRGGVALLEASIEGAHGVLLSIQGGSNLGIFEINDDAAQLVKEAAPGGEHHLRHGDRRHPRDEVRVT